MLDTLPGAQLLIASLLQKCNYVQPSPPTISPHPGISRLQRFNLDALYTKSAPALAPHRLHLYSCAFTILHLWHWCPTCLYTGFDVSPPYPRFNSLISAKAAKVNAATKR